MLLAGAASASAETPNRLYPAPQGFTQIAKVTRGACEAQVSTNLARRVYIISANGFEPNERGRIRIRNENLSPIDSPIRATGTGHFIHYYLPVHWRKRSGTANVRITSALCDLSLNFDWVRGVRIIDSADSSHIEVPDSVSW
jgi:hypothetical protein